MNYTNPLPRVCRAIEKYTEVKAIGFCHGIGSTARVIGEILDRHPDELGIRAAGVNHFHWLLDLRDRASGEDLYPLLRKGLKNHHPDKRNLWKDLFRCFGYLPFPSDDHIGEYLPFMHVESYKPWKKYGHDHWLLHWDGKDARRDGMWNRSTK